jgi:hypothetical protein
VFSGFRVLRDWAESNKPFAMKRGLGLELRILFYFILFEKFISHPSKFLLHFEKIREIFLNFFSVNFTEIHIKKNGLCLPEFFAFGGEKET